MIIIKISLGKDIRRLAIDNMMSYNTLYQVVTNMFSDLTENPNFGVHYIDNENDPITVGSDLELEEALRQLPNEDPKVLRLYITPRKEPIKLDEVKKDSVDSTDNSPTEVEQHPESVKEPEPNEPEVEERSPEKDLSVLESIEEKLQSAMNAVSTFVDSLELEDKFRDLVESVGKKLKQASSSIDEKIFDPLSKMTKVKVKEFKEEIAKLGDEIRRIKLQLKADLAKASLSNANGEEKAPNTTIPCNEVLNDLKQLEDMGFTDRKLNLDLLAKYPNNLDEVVNELLQRSA